MAYYLSSLLWFLLVAAETSVLLNIVVQLVDLFFDYIDYIDYWKMKVSIRCIDGTIVVLVIIIS